MLVAGYILLIVCYILLVPCYFLLLLVSFWLLLVTFVGYLFLSARFSLFLFLFLLFLLGSTCRSLMIVSPFSLSNMAKYYAFSFYIFGNQRYLPKYLQLEMR